MTSLDVMAAGADLRTMQDLARTAERSGFDGLWLTEGGRTSYGAATASVLATDSLTVGTGIAVAFARSPMVSAQAAWELHEASGGRFILGLGTQIRAHVERRYSASFDHPGPRLREYVAAVRAIWRAFRGDERLRFAGDFYKFSLLTPEWSPGAIEHPDPEIYLAAVNPWMLRMAGEVADGLHVHPLHSVDYLKNVVRPSLAEGAAKAQRTVDDITLVCPVMTAVGDTDEKIEQQRAKARLRIAFYASTPGYVKVLAQHGWEDVQPQLTRLFAKKDLDGMAALVTDDMLDVLMVTSSWGDLAKTLADRYEGIAGRVVCYSAVGDWRNSPASTEQWAQVARDFRALPA